MRNWWKWIVKKLKSSDGKLDKVFAPNKTIRRIFGISGEKKQQFSRIFQGVTQVALGAIPGVGPLLAGGFGAAAGAQRGGLGGALLGGATGFGLGSLGAGLRGGIAGAFGAPTQIGGQMGVRAGQSLLGRFGEGFAGAATQGIGGQLLGAGKRLLGVGAPAAAPAAGAAAGAVTQAPGISNLARTILGGGLLAATTLGKPPTFETDFPQRARRILELPNLKLAIQGIKNLALGNPAEILSPATDAFINASLRQVRESFDRQRNDIISRAGTQGRFPGKSGSLAREIRLNRQSQTQMETDFITKTNEARQVAAVGIKVNAIAQFYNVAQAEAANLLAVEGFITEQEAANFLAELQDFQGGQQLAGQIGGRLLESGIGIA